MSIPILSNKPQLPAPLLEAMSKLDLVSTLILMGFLLEHALGLMGLQKAK